MNLENFIQISKAKLLNSPSISKIYSIENSLSNISQGSLFISDNPLQINEAIKRGAYAILSRDRDIRIVDNEIAWIYTKDIDKAIKRVIRFDLINFRLKAYYLNKIEFEIIKTINRDDRVTLLEDDMIKNYKILKGRVTNQNIILSSEKEMLLDIYPKAEQIGSDIEYKIKSISKGTFLTTLIYRQKYYENLHISPLFIKQLERVLNFLDKLNIDFCLKNIHPLNHFHPIFVNNKLKVFPFGATNRVLIIESDSKLLESEYNFLKRDSPWAKIAKLDQVEFKSLNNIKELDIDKFNFILIKANYNEVIKILRDNSHKERSLLFGAEN